MIYQNLAQNYQPLVNLLKEGAVGVVPTDTLYGLVASAFNPTSVERIYQIKQRDYNKPFIILISSIDDLKHFDIKINPDAKELLHQLWPDQISIILPCNDDELSYLHRGTSSLAFRIPDHPIRELIKLSGPIVAPSANPEAQEPAKNIGQAINYFGNKVDFYVDGGELESLPSTLIKLEEDHIEILRQGPVKINKNLYHSKDSSSSSAIQVLLTNQNRR